MANPNKTVAAARKKMGGFPAHPPRPVDPFIEWLANQARSGAKFESMEQAVKDFEAEVSAKGEW